MKRMPDPTDKRARPVRGAGRASAAKTVADAVVAEAEKEGKAHLGKRRMTQLREALTLLREITAPYACCVLVVATGAASRPAGPPAGAGVRWYG
ncbi:conserved hypothetical protein [Streptomyces pristinaespiralis ATCC 25486]|uniref:Uncharacterized protein n=2 Tax=Streptomyces pristinaespiralis TaxID=38300 RepID=B5HCV2_STRE2|nr:MarR family transcriptional regulator [Streptomyces pristinaespiralis]EDY64675.1 conserved hypothetical protein [Streptomyces pristinaespiralis ATCC 25486]